MTVVVKATQEASREAAILDILRHLTLGQLLRIERELIRFIMDAEPDRIMAVRTRSYLEAARTEIAVRTLEDRP